MIEYTHKLVGHNYFNMFGCKNAKFYDPDPIPNCIFTCIRQAKELNDVLTYISAHKLK